MSFHVHTNTKQGTALSTSNMSSRLISTSSFYRTLIKSTRRGYSAVAADNVKQTVSTGATVMKNKLSGAVAGEKEDEQLKVFWMRDPKTGYWVPETHFDDVDVAELRAKLLSKNKQ